MKDEKGTEQCYGCCHHGMMGKHWYMLVGVFALVYGLVTWAGVKFMWTAPVEWMVGGVLLILVGWFKKWMWMQQKGM